MTKNKLSVVIPARNEKFLQQTINELLTKAKEEIEVIVTLDGYYPNPPLEDDKRLKLIHRGESRGMRNAINSAVAIADGEYLMKIDAHCMVDDGYDVKLKANCEDNWVVVPRRKRLDADNWCIQDVGKPDIDHMYLSFPGNPKDRGGAGLHGKLWSDKNDNSTEGGVIDLMSAQGSCYFMKRAYYDELELLDEDNYGPFGSEFQEVGLKCWLSGGRVVRNRDTWYAHLHKGKKHGRGYFLDKKHMDQANAFANKWIKGEAWGKQIKPLSWLIEKFWPVPTWTDENFKELFGHERGKLKRNTKVKCGSCEKKKQENTPTITPHLIKDRTELAQWFGERGYKVGAEIGVADGRYSEILLNNVPDLKLYAIDLWAPYDGNWRNTGYQNKAYKQTCDRLEGRNVEIMRMTSLEAYLKIPEKSLDFVFIDGCHTFDNAMLDIILWSRKVKKRGVVAGHDYCHFKDSGVVEAVNKYTEIHRLELNLIGRNQAEFRDDRQPCWFFVNK